MSIEKRAIEYAHNQSGVALNEIYKQCLGDIYKKAYIAGASEQRRLDIQRAHKWILDNLKKLHFSSGLFFDEFKRFMEE